MTPPPTTDARPPAAAPPSAARAGLAEFEAATLDVAAFDHAEHVRMAYLMLARHPFDEALARYAGALRRIAAGAGVPEKFHMTITVAFLALVAERMERDGEAGSDWESFAARHPELLDRRCLTRWYAPGVLASAVARRTFVLPAS